MDRITQVLQNSQVQLLADWVKTLRGAAKSSRSAAAVSDPELQAQCQEFISLLADALASGNMEDITADAWTPTREFLGGISRSRGRQGFLPSETAMFVLSFKEPLFAHLRRAFEGHSEGALFTA